MLHRSASYFAPVESQKKKQLGFFIGYLHQRSEHLIYGRSVWHIASVVGKSAGLSNAMDRAAKEYLVSFQANFPNCIIMIYIE